MYLGTIINPPGRYLWYRGYLRYRYLAVYLYIYVYEAPGVYPSRLGSQGVWD